MEETIIVNGVITPLKEYLKAKRSHSQQPKKKAKKQISETILAIQDINELTKKVKLLKSLSAYYDNAYRQWGQIAKIILSRKEIAKPFVQYRVKIKEVDKTINEINILAKKNNKAIFQYIETLSYQLDDIKQYIDSLANGISASGVISLYGNHESINGYGRRLGLKTLLSRTLGTAKQLQTIIERCNKVYTNGVDPLNYTKYAKL